MASSGARPDIVADFSVFKPAVAGTTTALPAVTYDNGASGVGATLTGAVALPDQDGVTIEVNDRLLVKDQSAPLQNGIYILTELDPFVLTRAPDCDTAAELESGGVVFLVGGDTQGDTDWIVHSSTVPAVLGTSLITWEDVGGGSITLPLAQSDVANLPTDLNLKAPVANPTFTGSATFTQQATTGVAFGVSGLTGATVTSRYVGATLSGSPSLGNFLVGDWIVDQTGKFWVCTVQGSPGTWIEITGASGSAGAGSAAPSFSKAGTIAIATGKSRWTAPTDLLIDSVIVSVDTAPVGSDLIIDVLKNGTTIFTTTANRPTVLDGTNEVRSVAPNITALTDGDYLTVDVIDVGSSVPGSDMTVQVIFTD